MSWMGKNVLITGGLGFIGSSLSIALVQLGAKVAIFDNLDPGAGGNQFNIDTIKTRVELLAEDIRNFDALTSAVTEKDVVINCAATTSHPHSMKEPWATLEVNTKGAINLAEACRQFNPRARLIQIGTSTQLGAQVAFPADEQHSEYPLDLYSATKSAAEKVFLIYGRAHGLPVSILRLPNVYGPRAAVHSPEFTFNNFFVGQALKGGPITVFGNGTQRRNLLFVDDAVSAILSLADFNDKVADVFFAGAKDHFSVLEIAEAIAREFDCQVQSLPWPNDRKSIEIGDVEINTSKIQSTLNWAPKTNLTEGLKITKTFYLSYISRYLT